MSAVKLWELLIEKAGRHIKPFLQNIVLVCLFFLPFVLVVGVYLFRIKGLLLTLLPLFYFRD